MTKSQALKAAQQRWGDRAAVDHRPNAPCWNTPEGRRAKRIVISCAQLLRRMRRFVRFVREAGGYEIRDRADVMADAERRWQKCRTAEDRQAFADAVLCTAKPTKANVMRAVDHRYAQVQAKVERMHEYAPWMHRYRFAVGYIAGVGGLHFFSIHGQGDTWEEALRNAGIENRPAA